jgi:hypothetical protein
MANVGMAEEFDENGSNKGRQDNVLTWAKKKRKMWTGLK